MWNPFKNQKQEEDEQNKQQADYNMSAAVIGAPTQADEQYLHERRELLVQLSQWQQDRAPQMRKLFLKLSGYQINQETSILEKIKWDISYCEMTGAAKLVGFIEMLDHNVMLANWDTQNILKTMRDAIAHPLRRFIFENHEELGIELNHAEYITWLIINTVEPCYWRGWNDGERRKDKEIIKVNELRNPYFAQKKKSMFGMEA